MSLRVSEALWFWRTTLFNGMVKLGVDPAPSLDAASAAMRLDDGATDGEAPDVLAIHHPVCGKSHYGFGVG